MKAQVGREETEERTTTLEALEKKRADKLKLSQELEKYRSCDPQTLKELSEC